MQLNILADIYQELLSQNIKLLISVIIRLLSIMKVLFDDKQRIELTLDAETFLSKLIIQ